MIINSVLFFFINLVLNFLIICQFNPFDQFLPNNADVDSSFFAWHDHHVGDSRSELVKKTTIVNYKKVELNLIKLKNL